MKNLLEIFKIKSCTISIIEIMYQKFRARFARQLELNFIEITIVYIETGNYSISIIEICLFIFNSKFYNFNFVTGNFKFKFQKIKFQNITFGNLVNVKLKFKNSRIFVFALSF